MYTLLEVIFLCCTYLCNRGHLAKYVAIDLCAGCTTLMGTVDQFIKYALILEGKKEHCLGDVIFDRMIGKSAGT